jgi:hypothetical protein
MQELKVGDAIEVVSGHLFLKYVKTMKQMSDAPFADASHDIQNRDTCSENGPVRHIMRHQVSFQYHSVLNAPNLNILYAALPLAQIWSRRPSTTSCACLGLPMTLLCYSPQTSERRPTQSAAHSAHMLALVAQSGRIGRKRPERE